MKNPQVLFVVAAVVLAGCVGQPGGGGGFGAGVIIKSFAPTAISVPSGTPVDITIEVKNVGQREAASVSAKLLGISAGWSGGTNELSLATTLGEGEGTTGFWTLTSPSDKKNIDITYDFLGRVTYGYKTDADVVFTVATSEYLRSVTRPGESAPSNLGLRSSTTTAGPLAVNARTKLPTVTKAGDKIRVQYEIQNVGGGRVYKTTPGDDILDIDGSSCPGRTSSEVRLAGGKSALITCEITTPSGFTQFTTVTHNLKLNYKYFVDSATTITVLGEAPK